MRYYRLDEHGDPVWEKDPQAWADWVETANTIVAKAFLPNNVVVATTFVGFSSQVPPRVWQTEIRGSIMDQQITTCAGNRRDAEKMHEQVVQTVKTFLEKHQPNKNQ
jgi:hypothetical protein